ncbi:hypothetical protein Lal_00002056 [Lupinus albus]|nr:hypothetical protein Lal_00002056 [Lupinus albus]
MKEKSNIDDNENRTSEYPPELNPNLTGTTRCDWVRVRGWVTTNPAPIRLVVIPIEECQGGITTRKSR